MSSITRIDLNRLAENATQTDEARVKEQAQSLQVAVYVMCGGGMLGRFAAEQPADFYIDSRCGRLPYGTRAIGQAVKVLVVLAKRLGWDPCKMPKMMNLHGAGIW